MRKAIKLTALAAAVPLLLSACGGPASNSTKSDTIKIGAVLALTGPNAAYGLPEANAAKVVVKSINAKGGVNGKKLELLLENGESNPTMAARKAQKLVSEGVVAIIGATTGSGTLAMAPIAHKANVPIVSVAATTAVTDPKSDYYSNTFRASLADQVAIPAIFEKIEESGAKNIAIFAQNDAYGQFGVDMLKGLVKDAGSDFKIVGIATAPLTATDVAAQATKLRNTKPDAVVLQLSSVDLAASYLRAASGIGLSVPTYGGFGMGQQVLADNAGASAAVLNVVGLFDAANLTPKQTELYQLLKDGGYTPSGGFGEALGGSAVDVVVAALQKAGKDADGAAVAKALNAGLTVDTYVPAAMKFSADFHDGCTKECVKWLIVKDGKYTYDASK